MDKEQLEHWRETRRAEQLQQALKWQHVTCCIMAVVLPALGYVIGLVCWGISAGTDDKSVAGKWQGLTYIGLATIGLSLWIVAWKLWGDTMLKAVIPVNLLRPISLW